MNSRIAAISAGAALTALLGTAAGVLPAAAQGPTRAPRITTHQQLTAEIAKAIAAADLSSSSGGGTLCGYHCPSDL